MASTSTCSRPAPAAGYSGSARHPQTPPRSRVVGAGLPAQRRVPSLAVPCLHRPDQSGARQPLRAPVPQVLRRTAVERLPAPHLPDCGPVHLPGDRRGARPAAPDVVLRQLLSLDYVIEHLHAAWLPTEDEKVRALTAARISKQVLPHRLGSTRARSGRRFATSPTSCR